MGVEINAYGSLLMPVLTAKILDDLRLRTDRKFDNEVWELSDILNLV